jgi:CYTH domain-containing protein
MNYEIERKFLIARPEEKMLSARAARVIDIEQTYLLGTENGVSRRVRKSTENGAVTYMKNEKRRISAAKREEDESEISAAEYDELLKSADPARHMIKKTRYCVPAGGLTAEIDLFRDMGGLAVCEVELPSEDADFILPDFITVLREVTDDPRFTNSAMAKETPHL